MIIKTGRFGELEVSDNEIYTFPKGIPGFEEQMLFFIVSPEEDEPFSFLQSVADGDLVFVIADPFLFRSDYDIELPESALAELQIESADQLMLRSIITIREDLDKATINLVAPIVFNVDTKVGKQVVLATSSYTTRHPLFPAVEKR